MIRRRFLQTSTAIMALQAKTYGQVVGANERIQVGLIGAGDMGMRHLRTLLTQDDVSLVHIADPDRTRLAAAVAAATRGDHVPRANADLRRVFDDRAVAAVFIATPDHWHAPAAILALDAGKHVYVESPGSHNIREGRLMIDAARRANKVCQVGAPLRSSEHALAAMNLLRDGAIGDVLAARVWNSRLRRDIGRRQPSRTPDTLDYDLWVGPAPMVPHQSNRLHDDWRWWHAFGSGDMGSEGVHDLDLGRWGLGIDAHPAAVVGLGGKDFFDDDREFPDTQTVVFEWPDVGGKKKQLVYEQRLWTPGRTEGHANGAAFQGTRGQLVIGREAGWTLFGEGNREIRRMAGRPNLLAHHRDFFACARSGRRPSADVEISHLSTTLCHLGNIATKVRRTLHFDPRTEEVQNDKQAGSMHRREYREGHWAVPARVVEE